MDIYIKEKTTYLKKYSEDLKRTVNTKPLE